MGYYNSPAPDGSRPGYYFINLRDTALHPSWTLPTLSSHEAVPGHHLDGATAMELDSPAVVKALWSNTSGEGWALYAEQLAAEGDVLPPFEVAVLDRQAPGRGDALPEAIGAEDVTKIVGPLPIWLPDVGHHLLGGKDGLYQGKAYALLDEPVEGDILQEPPRRLVLEAPVAVAGAPALPPVA